jgi:DNA-binding CsgD family transcriptional regulator
MLQSAIQGKKVPAGCRKHGMDHIKVFASLTSLLLSLFALFYIRHLSERGRTPLLRFLLLLAANHIVYETYAFAIFYTDVNIRSFLQYPASWFGKLLQFTTLMILVFYRALLIRISSILLGRELPFKLWRWLGVACAGLFVFLLAWIALPAHYTLLHGVYVVLRLLLGAIELTAMIFVLAGSRLYADPGQRALLRSFALLHLIDLAIFTISWSVYRVPLDSLPLRIFFEFVEPVYMNVMLPFWLLFFLRPWLTHSAFAATVSGLTGDLKELGLNDREREIVSMILLGKSNQAIADKMFVSEHTVKNTITGIYTKLNVANRKELFHHFLANAPKANTDKQLVKD